jgi:uncharacterized membrane protein
MVVIMMVLAIASLIVMAIAIISLYNKIIDNHRR